MLGRRQKRGHPVLWIDLRARLFGTGAILALFGIAGDLELLRWVALVVLAAAAALSIAAARAEGRARDEDEPEDP
jgi:hypothetical protein